MRPSQPRRNSEASTSSSNNAGVGFEGDLLETKEADVRRVLETNFFGALWMLIRVAREQRERGGRLDRQRDVSTRLGWAADDGGLRGIERSTALDS